MDSAIVEKILIKQKRKAEKNMKKNPAKDWIDHIVNKTLENYNGRQIVIWGRYQISDDISDGLKKEGVDTVVYVDSDVSKVDEKKVFLPDFLSGKSDKYYVVIPIAFYQSIREKLIWGGYSPNIDYYYFSDCAIQQTPEYYEDAHGNKIIGKYEGLKFCFSGFRSVIVIGDNVQFMNTSFYIHNDSKIVIGDNTQFVECKIDIQHFSKAVFGRNLFLENDNIVLKDEAKLEMKCESRIVRLWLNIGEQGVAVLNENANVDCSCSDGAFWTIGKHALLQIGQKAIFCGRGGLCYLKENASFVIGKCFSINGNYRIDLSPNTEIHIGDDCLFSYDINMRSNDAHSIFDIESKKNINSSYRISRSRKIIIGNHVWVGECAEILYNTQIGDGSIIGAMSLVKSIIPNNCIAAGIPARVIRKNIAWSRQDGEEDILECGEEYIHYTE